MNQQVIIIINPYCHQGLGWKRWLSVKEEVLRSFNANPRECVLEKGTDLNTALADLLQADQNSCIISAGGDGSIHYLVNVLLKSSTVNLKNITLGAIGLGSSNDFLKPFNKRINHVPVRIDLSGPVKNHDLGLVSYYDNRGVFKEQYFIVNASVGITATANWNFNNPGRILKFLKSNFTGGAILYTAVTTILQHKNINCRVIFNGTETNMAVSNINILKIPFVSGSFWYNHDIKADDGKLDLNICMDMNKMDLLKTLLQLEKGKFNKGEKRIAESITSFRLQSSQPVLLECDGETESANNISIVIKPQALKTLTL